MDNLNGLNLKELSAQEQANVSGGGLSELGTAIWRGIGKVSRAVRDVAVDLYEWPGKLSDSWECWSETGAPCSE